MTPYQLFTYESAERYARDLYERMDPYEDEDLFLITEEGREGVYKENYFLRKNLQLKYIHDPLSKPRNQEEIVIAINRFTDQHHEQLSTSGPVYSFQFNEKEVKFLYDIFGLSPDILVDLYTKMVAETYEGGKISPFFISWVKFAPHKVMFTAMQMEAVQNGWDDMLDASEYLWAYTEYPILYRDSYRIGVKKDVMDYTIEHLSSKHIITRMNSWGELLKYDSHVATVSCIEALRAGQDNTYSDIMQRYRNQFKSKMKNIAQEYYKNSENNSSMHNMTTEFDDGSKAEQEGHGANQAQIIERTINKISENPVNQELVRITAQGAKVDRSNLQGCIAQIYAMKDNKIPKMIEDIISAYFMQYPESMSIVNVEFLNFGLSLYRSLSNSKEKIYAEMSNILTMWMDMLNLQYDRAATLIAYRRAIFNYFMMLINYYN